MRSREEGVSLVELLIALALTGLTMAMATQLLLGSQFLFMAAAREARDPVIEIAVRQLRNDIQGSSAATSPGFPVQDWTSQPMELSGHARFDLIRYERTSDLRLVRTVEDGGRQVSRDLMHGVVSWRWIDLGGLVSLQVSIRREPWRGDPLHPTREMLAPQPVEELQWLNFALRGEGMAYGW